MPSLINRRPSPQPPWQRLGSPQGFTLIELLTALTLSMLLVATATSLFMTHRDTRRLQNNLSAVMENGFFALAYMKRDAARAGYRRRGAGDALSLGAASTALTGADNRRGQSNDALGISYQARAAGGLDCIGNNAEGLVTNTYFVQPRPPGRAGTLSCRAQGHTQPLVSGVVSFQVEYGIDSKPAHGDGVPDRYVTAEALEAAELSDGRAIIALRLGLVVKAATPAHPDQRPETIQVLDDGPKVRPSDDGRHWRISQTVHLRNGPLAFEPLADED